MLYRASDTIAAEHPELADQIYSLDAYLHDRQGQLFRLGRAVDFLDMEPKALERLLELYEAHGVVESAKVWICSEDGEILEPNEDGALFCDVCDTAYQPDDCETEIAYRPRPGLPITLAPSAVPFTHGYALLIGVGAYRHICPLAKAITDARDLHEMLLQSGYPAARVVLLSDDQATKTAISDRLDWLARRASPDETVVIFFSGHGAQRIGGFEPGEYLCPVEADWYNLRATAISDAELTIALRAIRAGRVAVFLDACHAGGVGEPKDGTLQVKAGLSEEAYARLAEGRGRVIVASCRPDEVSWELAGMRNGLFTHYLLEGLRGAAADADGAVRIFNLFDYVSKQVPQHKPQHPLFKAETELNFALALAGGKPTPSPPKKPRGVEPVMMPSKDRIAEYRHLNLTDDQMELLRRLVERHHLGLLKDPFQIVKTNLGCVLVGSRGNDKYGEIEVKSMGDIDALIEQGLLCVGYGSKGTPNCSLRQSAFDAVGTGFEWPVEPEPVMMPSQDRATEYRYLDTPALQRLLKDVRRNLELLLQQAVAYGGERFAPLHVQNQLNAVRDDIPALESVLAERSSLNERQVRCLKYLSTNSQITRRRYSMMFGVESKRAYRELSEMVDKAIIRRIGKGRSVHYVLAS